MLYYKLFISGVIVLATVYYIMIVLQSFGIISITNKEIKFSKAIIPFYYWIKG